MQGKMKVSTQTPPAIVQTPTMLRKKADFNSLSRKHVVTRGSSTSLVWSCPKNTQRVEMSESRAMMTDRGEDMPSMCSTICLKVSRKVDTSSLKLVGTCLSPI
jgi:hypothetical protein